MALPLKIGPLKGPQFPYSVFSCLPLPHSRAKFISIALILKNGSYLGQHPLI
jgi:hypothetical protein